MGDLNNQNNLSFFSFFKKNIETMVARSSSSSLNNNIHKNGINGPSLILCNMHFEKSLRECEGFSWTTYLKKENKDRGGSLEGYS